MDLPTIDGVATLRPARPKGTAAYQSLRASTLRLLGFFNFVVNLSRGYDQALIEFTSVAEQLNADPESSHTLKIEGDRQTIDELDNHIELMWELILCRHVDDFMTYISDLMALVFKTRPEALKSKRAIPVEKVLDFASMDELVQFLAEDRVNDLAYMGMRELARDLSERLGFELFDSGEELERSIVLVELRNVIVHSRGIASRVFLSRVPNYPIELGQRINLRDTDELQPDLHFLLNAAYDIDKRAIAKFSLDEVPSDSSAATVTELGTPDT